MTGPGEAARATFRDVFAVGEFRALWLAQLLSVAGDQLARVAMTVLVYDRTHSPLWSAITFAVTFLPWIVGGLGLSGLADRIPRRQVMITCDLARFAFGGLVVAGLGVRAALLADAATFAVSALLVGVGVRRRPAAIDVAGAAASHPSQFAEMLTGARLVFGDVALRRLMLLGWLVAFYVVPMGLAAPYAARFHELPLAVAAGLIFAAVPLGSVIGALVFSRAVAPARRQRWMGPLAVSSCGLLVLCVVQPGLIASLTIFAASGACAAYQITANAAFVAAVPAERRGQAFGLANGGMQVSQGLWFVAAGAAAETVSPAVVIAISGGLGAALAAALAMRSRPAAADR